MKKWIALVLLGGFMSPLISSAIDLKQSKFTQVVNNVEIISAANKALHPAAVNDIFSMPDVLRTGPDSRAELEATDGTITRVGANTIFSFEPASRTIKLEQGSLLFHSPHGKGGGTIQTGSATASVIGTTIIVTCTPSGGFKLLDLEGQAEIRYLDGLKQTLEPGQMTFILSGGSASPVIVFRLDTETKGSALVGGFNTPLDSQSKINSEVTQQLLQILNGTAADTGYVVGNNATVNSVQVIVDDINNTPQSSTTPPPTIFSNDGSVVGSDRVSTLPVDYSPLDPAHTFDSSIAPLTADEIAGINGVDSFFQGLSFLGLTAPASGFIGNNIDIDTANVDLSSFAGKSDFDIMAAKDMRIWQSVDFNGGNQPDVVSLFAGGQMLVASSVTLEADTGIFGLVADSFDVLNPAGGPSLYPNILWNDNIYNTIGDIDILSLSDLQFDGGNVCANGEVNIEGEKSLVFGGPGGEEKIEAGGSVHLTAGGDLEIANNYPDSYPPTEVYSYGSDENGNGIATSSGGDTEIYDSDLYAHGGDVDIEAGGALTLNSGGSSESIYASGSIYLAADNGDVNIDNTDITALHGGVDIEAYDGYLTLGPGDDVTIAANFGDVTLYGNAGVDLESTGIYAYYGGNVSVSSDGYIFLSNDGISAYGDEADIYSHGASIQIDSSDIYSYGGDVNIYASGTADIEDTYIEADGNVNIESGGTLYLGWFDYGGEIYSDGGTVNLTSDNGDVDIDDDEIYAYGSDENGNGINISAGVNVDIEDSSEVYAYGGGISITANDSAYLYDDDIYAYDDVNITSGAEPVSEGDAVDIEGSRIYAGWHGENSSSDGGSVNITANNGDVYLYDDDIEASSGESSDGDVNIHASAGSVELDYVYNLYADGSINIESGDTLTVQDSSYLEAYNGDVTLKSDNADVDIYDSEVYSDYGNVNINADNGGVYVSDGDIEAGYDADVSTGDVNIRAYNGTADIENTYISAQGNVSIESSGTLTLNYYQYDDYYADNYEVYANNGSVSLKSDNADVDITGYDIYAYGTDADGNGVTISAAGNVSVNNSYFGVSNDGNISVNAGGNIDVLYTEGSGNGSINLAAGGYVNVYDYGLDIASLNVTAGTFAALGADQYAHIHHSSIKANGGGVNITGNSAGVDIDGTSITATGDIDVTAGVGNYEEIPYVSRQAASSVVAPFFVARLEPGVDFVILGTFTPETFTVPTIGASADNVTITGAGNITFNTPTTIEALNSIGISAGGNIDDPQVDLIADGGDLVASAGEAETIDSAYIKANGTVYLTAVGSVSLSDSLASSYDYADIYADNGDVDIQSSGGTVDIENTYIYAHGSVIVDSSGTLTMGGTGNTVAANQGDVSLTSDSADIDAANYGIYSDYGNVKISAAGNVNLSGDAVYSGYDSGYDSGYSGIGSVNIQSLTGTVDLEDTYIYAAGNVGILSYGTLTLGNSSGSEIDADTGWANLSSTTGDVDIDNYSIYTYGSDIDGNGVTISAAAGSLSLSGDSINAYNSGDVIIAAVGAGGTADIAHTSIFADSDVSIESSGTLTFQDSSEIDSYGDNGISLKSDNADVDVYGGYLYAYNGDVNIAATGVSGTIDLEGTYIYAEGDVDIKSTGILALGNESGSTIESTGGSINLTSVGRDVDIYNNYGLDADGSDINGNGITISAGGNVDIEDDYDIYADYGGVKIGAVGSVTLYDDDIEAGYDSYYYNNDMNIISSGSTVDVAGTYLYAAGDVNITSSGLLTIEDSYDSSSESYYYSEIDSYGSSGISLTSGNSDVGVYDSSLYAYYGDVDITALSDSAVIDLQNDDISAYGNLNVESDGTLTLGNVETGGDTIYAGSGVYLLSDNGNVDVYNSTIDGGFDGTVDDTTIENGSTLTSDTDVNIKAYGATVSIHAPNGSVYVDNTTVNPGGSINISDSLITAGANGGTGGVDIYSGGYFYVGGYSDRLYYDDIEGNNINISGSTITANNGGVSILNDAYISTLDSVGFNVENSTVVEYGDITISASQITANNGGVDILTASSDLSHVYVDEGSSLSVGDISISGSTIKATGAGRNVTISAGGSLADTSASETLALVGDTVMAAGGTVTLTAQGDVDVDQDVSDTTALTAGSGDVDVTSHNGSMDVENSTVLAGGSVALSAAGSVTLNNGSVTGIKNVSVNAGSGITINGVAITANDPDYGTYLTSTAGQTTIQNGSSVAGNLTVNSPDGILIDGSRGGAFSGSTISLTAGGGDANGGPAISVQNADLSGYATVNMAAHTVNLLDVAFGGSSAVNLHSYFGALASNPNTGQVSVPGYVNFINGVTYGGDPAQNHIGSGITISGL